MKPSIFEINDLAPCQNRAYRLNGGKFGFIRYTDILSLEGIVLTPIRSSNESVAFLRGCRVIFFVVGGDGDGDGCVSVVDKLTSSLLCLWEN